MSDYQNISITNIGSDALDTALNDKETNGDSSSDSTAEYGAEWRDDLLASLEDAEANLEEVINGDGNPASANSTADGELTGGESFEELASELEYATNELADAFDAAEGGEGGSDLTPQEFMSKLNDVAGKSDSFGEGESDLLEQGKRLVNASPEKQQEFLKRAEDPVDDGKVSRSEAKDLKSFVDGLLAGDSQSPEGSDDAGETEDKSFMDQVDDILAQSEGEGPGEKMAREAAKMLEDNPEEDQKAFLAELEKMLNNEDGDYDKDIDETNDGEGSMLKNMAEAFDDLPSDRGESRDGSSGMNSSSDGSSAISAMLDLFQSKYGDGGSEITDAEASALRAVLDTMESSEAELT
jgi:hypothetical protein